jgi:hypothetical protein
LGPEDRRHLAAEPWLPPHHLEGEPRPFPLTAELSVGCGDGDVSIIFPCLHQIVNEIRNDLSEFKCGMAHLFCMYINDVFLNDYAFFPFGS